MIIAAAEAQMTWPEAMVLIAFIMAVVSIVWIHNKY